MLDERIYEELYRNPEGRNGSCNGVYRTDRAGIWSSQSTRSFGKRTEHITAKCSGNIIKNVRCVIIPNSGGLTGIEAGVVLGAVAGNASLNMEVLSNVNEFERKRCRELLDKKDMQSRTSGLPGSPALYHRNAGRG